MITSRNTRYCNRITVCSNTISKAPAYTLTGLGIHKEVRSMLVVRNVEEVKAFMKNMGKLCVLK